MIIDRKTKRYPLQVFVEPENWDRASSKVINRADKNILNRIITNELAKVNAHYLQMRESENICFERLNELYLKIDNTKISDIVALHCKTISPASYKFYNTAERELKKLFGDISINKIDYKKIVLYHDSIKHLGHNTIWCKHKSLKTLINTAIKHKLYHNDNPYNIFKWKYKQPIATTLTTTELNKIAHILELNDVSNHIKYYTKAFLFQCYTGLRYSDLKQLKFDHIQSNSIVLEQIKTDDIVYVPLINMAKAIIKDQDESNKFVFKMNSNQKYNAVLKDIVFLRITCISS